VVTARALAITASDGDTHSPGTAGRECEESVLTGESLPAEKLPEPFRRARPLAELRCCALMGPWCTPVPPREWQPHPEEG
jgi:magnesium-transporting ATPase (P-type)